MPAVKGGETPQEPVRLDKWLWAARFFKTRSLATEAIAGGHVHLNGNRVKPARPVRCGDLLTITKAGVRFEVTVIELSSKRGSAPEAQRLYRESEESARQREEDREQRRLSAHDAPHPDKRPDKRARRRIIRFTERGR